MEERGLISREDLSSALSLQKENSDRIGKILVDLGFVSEKDVLSVLSEQIETPLFDGEYPAVPVEADRLGYRFLRASSAVPVHLEETVLSVVMGDPLDSETRSAIRLRTGHHLKVFMASESEIVDELGPTLRCGTG